MPITLDQLAPFLTNPLPAMQQAAVSMRGLAEGARQDNQLAEHARQHDTSLASEEQRAAAQLAELHGYHGATLDQGQQQIDAATHERRANALLALHGAIKSGDYVGAKALMPYLQELGVNGREMAGAGPALPDAPQTQLGAPPPQLAAFADMPQLSAPALAAPPPAPPGPSGIYGFDAGGKDLGQLDLNQLSAEQRAQAAPIFEAMKQSSLPGEAPHRNPVIDAASSNPMFSANPALGAQLVEHATDPMLQRRQSGINASAVSAGQNNRAGASDARQAFQYANNQVTQAIDKFISENDIKGLNASLASADELEQLASSPDNSLEHNAALIKAIRASGMNRMNQTEITNFMKAQGLSDLSEQTLNRVFGNAEFSRGQRNRLIEMARNIKARALAQRADLSAAAGDLITTNTALMATYPQYIDSWVRNAQQRVLGGHRAGPPQSVPRLQGANGGDGAGSGGSKSLKGPPAAMATGFDPDHFSATYGSP